jgi:hypothetical protein
LFAIDAVFGAFFFANLLLQLHIPAKREYVAQEFEEGTSVPSGRFYVNPFKY